MVARVFLVDDSADALHQIETLLRLSPDRIEVVGRATSGHAFLRGLPQFDIDLACLDLSMPRLNGVEVLQRLRVTHPTLPVLILTTFSDPAWVRPALDAGANGYVLKTSTAAELIAAIESVLAGTFPTNESVLTGLADSHPTVSVSSHVHLSPTEREVLGDLVDGLTNTEIASLRHLSLSSVKQVLVSLSVKLGARNRTHLVSQAARRGLVSFMADDAVP